MIKIAPLTISVMPRLLSPEAVAMIRAMGRNPECSCFCVRGVSHPHPTIRLKDQLGWCERARRFGLPGRSFADLDARERYLARTVAVYGDHYGDYTWTLPAEGVGAFAHDDGEAGAQWLNDQAMRFQHFLFTGYFTIEKETP